MDSWVPWEYYSDFEQDMRAEGATIAHEQQFHTVGKCIACLETSVEVDGDSLCAKRSCQGTDAEYRRLLLAMLTN